MSNSVQRLYLLAAVAAAGILAGDPVVAQAPDAGRFPTKALRIISPFPPGGSNDVLARLMAQKLTDRLGQQTVVDNRPGAAGVIGTELGARAPADGHTLIMIATTFAQVPAISKVSFDPIKSFQPLALIATAPNAMATHPGFAASNINELIAMAKAKPGTIRYASTGIGGYNHFAAEQFNQLAGVKLEHIPYKGAAPAMIDVMGGQIEVVFGSLVSLVPHLRSGKLKPLGIGAAKRSPLFPNVQTFAETLPGYDGNIWWGMLLPAGVPGPLVTRLNNEINAILREPELIKHLSTEAAEPGNMTPEAFGKIIEADLVKWARIAKEANIRAE